MNSALLRTLVIYAVCVVLAIWLGFLLAGPLTYSSLGIYGLLAFILISPILLRWHYPLLLLSWSFAAVVFFLPGRPSLGLAMILLSLGISVLQRTISSQSHFIRVPQITLPLFCIIAVIAFTARMTGAGLHVFGSEIYGGKKYVYLVGAILGYFALTVQRIPPERRNLYLGLFFLGGVTGAISDLVSFLPRSFYFIYWFFNVNTAAFRPEQIGLDTTRFTGAPLVSFAVFSFMLARYGIRGIFLSHRPLRWMILILAMIYGFLGGFRWLLIAFAVIFVIQFYLEGLHRTKLLPIFLTAGILGALALIPLSPHLPFTFQRVLSFLPYRVGTAARLDAQGSLDWRFQMWQAILPQVPNYLLLGKGYVLSQQDFDFMTGPEGMYRSSALAENDPMALSEDFHNGPLSVVIPFGIWGCLAFLWFIIAALRVLYLNWRYGDPALRTMNSFLLAAFGTRALLFFFAGGDFSSDMMQFCGFLGLNVALNGGMRRPVRVVQPARRMETPRGFVRIPPAPAPDFQRRQPGTSR